MIETIVMAVSWALIALGSFFVIVGALGLVRMPELYTRMHAASVSDTFGASLLMFGLMLQSGFDLVTVKLIFLVGLFIFSGPVVTHALAQAALHEKIEPLLSEDRRAARAHEMSREISGRRQ